MGSLEKKRLEKQKKQLLNKANKLYLQRDENEKEEYKRLTKEANVFRDQADEIDSKLWKPSKK